MSLTGHLGGPTRSLATLLPLLEDGFQRVLVVAGRGMFAEMVAERSLVHTMIGVPRPTRLRRASRLFAAGRMLAWAIRHRRSLVLIHANGVAELNVVGPTALLLRKPVAVWAHGSELDPWSRRFLPMWRRLLRLRWAAVSRVAQTVLTEVGVPESDIAVIPNPIDPRDVKATRHSPKGFTVGFLGYPLPNKGLQILPRVVKLLPDLEVTWLVFTSRWNHPDHPHADDVFDELEAMGPQAVHIVGHLSDVREAYAQCSVVFCPSLQESFCRVAAEAMVNGIPVVGSAIPALEEVVGNGRAGLLFPTGDADAAATAIRQLAESESLRNDLGERGRTRADDYMPSTVARQMVSLYGLNDYR